MSGAQDRVVPVSGAQDKVVPVSGAQDRVVPVSGARDGVVPAAGAREKVVPSRRAPRAVEPVPLVLGLGLLAAVWVAPLALWFGSAFAGHMVRHMVLVAMAAPLLVLGWPRLGRALALSPAVAAGIEFAVVWGWHLPGPHAASHHAGWAFGLEQASFLVAGVVVWAGCLRAAHPLAGAGGLLLTSMHMTLLGALLVLAPRDLYATRLGLLPQVEPQRLGGLIMLGIGTPVYLVAGLALTARALRGREAAA